PVVVMVNEFGRETAMRAASQLGIGDCLSKPVNPARLLAAVAQALGLVTAEPASLPTLHGTPWPGAQRIAGALVLVVDDNVINQQVAREVLLGGGVHVELANNGMDAVRMVDAGRFDAVLMDIQMPEMDGYEATALIRARHPATQLPVIAMTAHAVAGFRENSLAMGMNDYVTKPIEPERLFAVLANWIGPLADDRRQAAPAPVTGTEPPPAAELTPAPGSSLPPAAGLTPVPGIDTGAALARLGGNRRLLTVLLDKFVEEFAATPQQLQDALDAGQVERAALLVHKVKGAAGNLSMGQLHGAADVLERVLRSAPAERDASLAGFTAAFETVLGAARAGADGGH
ncbi:MAG: response regulator, partial [Duganella sp.]